MPYQDDVFLWRFGTGCSGDTGTCIVTNTTVINNSSAVSHFEECNALNAEITNYDFMARQPQSWQLQGWITEQKKRSEINNSELSVNVSLTTI